MIRLNNIKIPLDYNDDTLLSAAAAELRVSKNAVRSVSLFRRSVDARKKDRLHFICALDVTLNISEAKILSKNKSAVKAAPYHYEVKRWALVPQVCLPRWFLRKAAQIRLFWSAAKTLTRAQRT